MAIEKKMICPLMHGQCIEGGAVVGGELRACRFWIHIIGKHPQTGADQDLWDCSFAWMPVLMVENSKMQRETGAAVESFRNEMVTANKSSQKLLLATAQTMGMPTLKGPEDV